MRLALLVSHQTCSQDDEMTSEPHVSVAFTIDNVIVFTIDHIDVLLQNGPIPLPLHLSQILISFSVRRNKQISNAKAAFVKEKKKHVYSATDPSPHRSSPSSTKRPQNLVQASTTFLLFS